MFKTIYESVSAEIVEKKSRFIADIFYVETKEEAEEKIKYIKKKYYDAKHHCFAYSILGESGNIDRFSDDGEPSGTAGSPMLNIINSSKLCNIVVIVTRYFGGTLLGTGGLARAYCGSFNKALENAKIVEKDLGYISEFKIEYSDIEKLKYFFSQEKIRIVDIKYDENVSVYVEIQKEKYNRILENKAELKFRILESKITKESYIFI